MTLIINLFGEGAISTMLFAASSTYPFIHRLTNQQEAMRLILSGRFPELKHRFKKSLPNITHIDSSGMLSFVKEKSTLSLIAAGHESWACIRFNDYRDANQFMRLINPAPPLTPKVSVNGTMFDLRKPEDAIAFSDFKHNFINMNIRLVATV